VGPKTLADEVQDYEDLLAESPFLFASHAKFLPDPSLPNYLSDLALRNEDQAQSIELIVKHFMAKPNCDPKPFTYGQVLQVLHAENPLLPTAAVRRAICELVGDELVKKVPQSPSSPSSDSPEAEQIMFVYPPLSEVPPPTLTLGTNPSSDEQDIV
jgi:hypothetical protein